jgi:teichoic acid transport system ATP-binding protein
MTSPSIVADGLDIVYRTYLDPASGLRDRLKGASRVRRRFRDIHAVQRVSFTINDGESVGVVGHNGAGKSSLLLGLAGLVRTTGGEVRAIARPSLLGVGATFQPSLSGQHNIEMGCLALGMSRREVNARMDEFLDFAGLADFADVPLRAYSSGMRARLSFTIATVVTPEILLIDEALAVGDLQFRDRAIARIDEITQNAGCVIIVSHNLTEVRRLCERTLWLDHGQLIADGETGEILDRYESSGSGLDNRPEPSEET